MEYGKRQHREFRWGCGVAAVAHRKYKIAIGSREKEQHAFHT
jgi:hypothetical protein